jgi:P-type conjugative transfer protein TrbJ
MMRFAVSRRGLLAAGACAAGVAALPRSGHGQWAVACVNCATVYTQMLQYAKEAASYVQQVQTQLNTAQQLYYTVLNTTRLPLNIWDQIQGNYNAIHGLFNAGTGLLANASMASGQLYGMTSLLGQTVNMPQLWAQFSRQMNDTITATMRGLGMAENQTPADFNAVAQIRAHSAGAQGTLQAIQANTEMGDALDTQLVRMRQLMQQDLVLNANYVSAQVQERAAEQADLQNFFSSPQQPVSGNKRY